MSFGLPIAQRPGCQGGADNFASRIDAVFGNLGTLQPGAQGAQGTWSLRQNVEPFQAGKGVDEYAYSSDEEDAPAGPMPSSMIDSDQEEEDEELQKERCQVLFVSIGLHGYALCSYRRVASLQTPQGSHMHLPFYSRYNPIYYGTCYGMQGMARLRKAFEEEDEEDEYDRVATQTLAMARTNVIHDWDKPSGQTEVRSSASWGIILFV
jgi:hypothetical protein